MSRALILVSMVPVLMWFNAFSSDVASTANPSNGSFLLDIGGSFDYTGGRLKSVFGYGGEGYFSLGGGSGKLIYELGVIYGSCNMNADTFKHSVSIVDQFGNVSSAEIAGNVLGVMFGIRKFLFPKKTPANRFFYSGGLGCLYEKRWESPGGEKVKGYVSDPRRGAGFYAKGTVQINGLPNDTQIAPGIGLYFLIADAFTFGKGYSQIIENERKSILVQDIRMSIGLLVSLVRR